MQSGTWNYYKSRLKITPQGIAVLDVPDQLSKWIEDTGRLCHDDGVYVHYVPHIKRDKVVIDCGAALGDHTIVYADCVGASNVYAFEANPDMFECLKHNVPKCNAHCVALSDHIGELRMFRQPGNLGGSICVEDGMDLPSGIIQTDPIVVKCAPLDSFGIQNVGFIKWDIEGGEVDGLLGARDTIMQSRPTMIVEANEDLLAVNGESISDLLDAISGLGYSISVIMGDLKSECRGELLCIPK